MSIFSETFTLETRGETDIIDITDQIEGILDKSKLTNGTATVFVGGSTAGITTIEFEAGLLQDLREAFERLAPRDGYYAHNERWGDGNGYSHVRAALLGPSLQVPLVEGNLLLGTWQQIVLTDFDNRPRERKIVVQIIGE